MYLILSLQTSSLDLLVPHVGELAGGTLREERVDKLTNRLKELEMSEEHYGWSACKCFAGIMLTTLLLGT